MAILFFILSYLLLFTFAVLLTIACVYAGIFIIVVASGIWTIVLGLASVGILVLIFLIKFLFK